MMASGANCRVGELASVCSVMAGYDGHRGQINYLAVEPGTQRTGIGRRMMEEAETKLKALGCPKINLQVRTSNTKVIAFYEAIGYKLDEVVSLDQDVRPVTGGRSRRNTQALAGAARPSSAM